MGRLEHLPGVARVEEGQGGVHAGRILVQQPVQPLGKMGIGQRTPTRLPGLHTAEDAVYKGTAGCGIWYGRSPHRSATRRK